MPKSLFRKASKKILVVSNIIVALLFLTGCYSKWFFSPTFWPVGLLSLSAFYLLIVLILFLVFWLLVKPGWSLIFIFTIILSFNRIRQIIPFRLSESEFSLNKDSSNIRVMSWNVAQFDILVNKKKPAVRDNMLSLINEYKPDIACFQEMVAADTLVNLNTAFYKEYSFYSIFEFAEKLQFPDYYYAYNYKDNFFDNEHFGIIIFSRYPIIKKQKISYYPYQYNSCFEYIDVVANNDTLRIFNIHLQSLKFSPENFKYIEDPGIESKVDLKESKSVIGKMKNGFLKRQLQADRIRTEIDKSPYPVILCGDFNDVPNSYAYEKIGDGFQNAFVEKGAGLGRTFSGIAPTLRIDNIFVDKRFSVNQYTKVNKKLSDHFPIFADISKKPE